MDKCVDCNKSHEVSKSRYKCSGKLCQAWTHKQCSDKRQFSKEGYWYCKNHIIDIPLSDRKTNDDEEVSSEHDEEQPKDPKVDNKVNETDKKEDEKIVEEDSSDQFTSLNPNVTKRKDKKKIVPFDNGDDYNPFANFNCVDCNEKFTKELPGALCTECRSTYHLICLNDSELEDVKNNKFTCQHCIENQIRINNLSNDKKDKNKVQNKDNKKFTSSTPKIFDLKSKTKFSKRNQIIESESSLSLTSTDSFSSSDTDDSKNIKQKYNKLKRLMKQRKSKRHSKKSQSRFSSSDESELKVTQSDAMIGIYRLTKEERDKAKYDKLPIVDNVDTKWAVFFDLFKQSRKMFSDSENVLRIQKSLKAKEILEIGGISLFDPRTYWEAIKLIDDRLSKSHNLLLRETNEIIKLKKLRNDVESKKIIEFINRIINYSHIVERYGKKKHKVDDRIISHIGNIMPYSLMNGWHKAKGKLEDKDKTIYIKDVANYLSKQVSTINSKMQSEELDPWKENTSKPPFKRNDFGYKRTYNTNAKSMNNIESFNYCWLHKSKSHSPFDCTKLWELSGKEVSELARKNGICTFCGLRKHKDCHTTKSLNCKMENCNLKHHILFCYKRSGKINRNNYGNNKRNENNNKSNVRTNNSNKNPPNQPRLTANNNNSHHNDSNNEIPQSTDDTINVNNTINSEEEEVTIPPSNFYLNQPPASIKIKKNNQGRNRNSLISFCNENNQSYTIRCDFIQTHTSLNKVTRSAQCILGVIVIRFIENNENIAFLMDSGSTVSIIEESLANKLELKGIWSPLKINWSSEINRIDYGSRIVKVKVSSTSINSREYNLYLRTVKNLNIIDQAFDADEITELYPYLAPMHLTSYCKVYGILGIDNLWCFNQITTFKPNNWNSNEPYGIRCPLGDYVVGCFHQLSDIYNYLKNNPNNNSILNTIGNVFSTQFSLEEEKELANMEKIILGLEYNSFDENDNNSYEDSLALELLNLYVKRSDNNINFEAPLLWRTLDIHLPTEESFKIAYKRLLIVEKNSLKNGRFNECVEQVDNLLRKNYAEIVPQSEINLKGGKIFYLPTFFIQPKNKRTRFIWDAATKVLGKSLNDYLLAGPNMYTNYLDIILQMREGKFIIKGDLQEMFHQVIMRKEDRDSLRFLFRKSPNDKIQILRMRVMIFGSKSSPTTSQFVKNKVAEPFAQSHPNAYNVIVNKTYVDDVITSIDDLQSGQILINDVRNILKTGGFNLVKLKSNCNDILDIVRKNLSPDDLKNEKLFSKDDTEKLLGYTINFHTDELSIALTLERIPEEILNCTNKPTKKQVLKLTMSIFDPIGIIEFLISKFKLIYNWLIKDNYEWNQIMSDDYFIIWKKCLESLKEITNIKIPRIYSHKLSDASIKQLVGFGDAGIEMLCAVIYLRLLDDERNQIDYKFVCSKSYTVPYRQSRTIPDLEVDIACKLSILMTKIEKALTIKIDEKINFTDNSAIKEWIINGAKNPKIYVHNRLEKIKKFSKIEEWKWTPTHLQPADFGTKISSMPIISYHNDWFHPPLFQLPESNWPTIETNSINHSVSNIVNIPEEDISENLSFIHNFSCFDRLITGLSKALEWKHRVEIIKINRQIKAINSVRFTRRNYNKNRMILESLKEKKREVFKSIDMIRNGYKKHEASIIRIA